MFEKQRKAYPPKPDNSRDTQVLRSISAQSAVSLDQNESQQLMMKQLMLAIELDRKDNIIRQLLQIIQNDDSRHVIEELNIKCSKYEIDNKSLRETIAMLKENISSIELAKNNQMFTSMSQFNQELEVKVTQLESKLRKVQEEKIDIEHQLSKIKTNQTLEGYKSLQNEHNEKNRVRQLETQLAAERAKNQTERKTLYEKNLLLDQLKNKVMQYDNRQKVIITQYQQKLRTFHSEMMFHQNLKKSQISSTEDRINTLNLQLANSTEEIRHLKNSNEQLRETIQAKEREMNKLINEFRTVESTLIRTESNYKQVTTRLQSVSGELRSKEKENQDKAAMAQRLTTQIQEMKYMFTSKGEEANLYSTELQRLRTDNIDLQAEIKRQNMQIRRLKKKPPVLCQGCKARQMGSSSYISSQKSIKSLNIGQIIQQTEQLFKSNRRMQSMINRHESNIESSIHLYPPHHTVDL